MERGGGGLTTVETCAILGTLVRGYIPYDKESGMKKLMAVSLLTLSLFAGTANAATCTAWFFMGGKWYIIYVPCSVYGK